MRSKRKVEVREQILDYWRGMEGTPPVVTGEKESSRRVQKTFSSIEWR